MNRRWTMLLNRAETCPIIFRSKNKAYNGAEMLTIKIGGKEHEQRWKEIGVCFGTDVRKR